MSKDKRNELIWQMIEAAKEYEAVPLAIGPRAMAAALDIALKAAAEVAVRNSHCRPCADDIGRAIRALKGVSTNDSLT